MVSRYHRADVVPLGIRYAGTAGRIWENLRTSGAQLKVAEGVTFGKEHTGTRINGEQKCEPCQHRRICTRTIEERRRCSHRKGSGCRRRARYGRVTLGNERMLTKTTEGRIHRRI